jgi:tetratricopeptide (TPR) repeat protein
MQRWLLVALLAAACSSKSSQPMAQPQGYDPESLGSIKFSLSEGTPEARTHWMRGMLALHSFWYDEATRQFHAAITADSTMNMAYWGAAMSHIKLLWGDDDLDAAKQVLSRIPDPDRLPEREQAWVIALVELLRDDDTRTSRRKFVAAMSDLHQRFPDDESATFLAVALLAAMRPDDPDQVAVRLRAGALSLGVLGRNPKHPGAAHYLIHAYDTPSLAVFALPFAYAYAGFAPAAFHVRHMPAHIFARLGMWNEAIRSCQSAWDVSVAAADREHLSTDHRDFHSLNWIVEMSFELGRRKDADVAMAEFANAVRGGVGHQTRTAYAAQVASYMARTGEWSRVDELLAPLQAPATDNAAAHHQHGGPSPAGSFAAQLEAMAVLDARVRAAAMQRDVARTEAVLVEFAAQSGRMRQAMSAMQPPDALAKADEALARHREAMLARARGDDRALIAVLRLSADESDQEVGGESTPVGLLQREEIADALMRLGDHAAARAEYELVLAKHPRRARALLGAARASAKAGDATSAKAHYRELANVWATADAKTEGLDEARAAR